MPKQPMISVMSHAEVVSVGAGGSPRLAARHVYVSRLRPRLRALEWAAEHLVLGGLAVHATETLYGLSAAMAPDANAKLLAEKGGTARPFALLVPDRAWLERLCVGLNHRVDVLVERFWPGPLTIVAQANERCPSYLRSEDGTVAMRVSSSPVVAGMLSAMPGLVLVSTSANRTGEQPASSGPDAARLFPRAFVLDSGALPESEPSTVARVRGEEVEVLRRGVIPDEAIREAWRAG